MTTYREIHPFAGRDVNWLVDLQSRDARRSIRILIWEPFAGERRVWTYAEFRRDVLRVAAGLVARGVTAGDRVLVHLDNCPELELLWFACHRIGAVIVTTNTRSAGPEIAYYAEASGAVAAITQPELAGLVAEHAKAHPLARRDRAHGRRRARASMQHCPRGPSASRRLLGDAGDAADTRRADPWRAGSVQFTSGTTARPKPVLWTHGNALWGARASALHEGLMSDRRASRRAAVVSHQRAHLLDPAGNVGWRHGRAAAALLRRRFWDVALRNRCTWHSSVGFCFKALAAQPMPDTTSFPHARHLGQSTPPFAAFFGVPVIGWWGMTETITQGIVGEFHLPNRPLTTGRPPAATASAFSTTMAAR